MLSFKETGLSEELLMAIEELEFEQPTPIQEKVIPALLNSKQDLIGLAQTGTGKTAAYGLPLIHQTHVDSHKIQTLVLCPTRELCMQITGDLKKLSKYVKGFKVVAIYGGSSISNQIRALKDGCHIVVGTPGRVLDLITRNALKISSIRWLILDEADEMLNMGFKEDLDSILEGTPSEKQTLLFSATMPREISEIAEVYMDHPLEISVGKRNAGAENVRHEYYVVHVKDRYKALKRIADINPDIYGIIFCRTRQETKEIAEKMMADGYNADALYGDLSQAQRDSVMNRFRSKHLQILVATDVAARGLDVTDLTHVINYNLPDDLDIYIHRSGRTGRAGKSGISISIIHTRETYKMNTLAKMTKKDFEQKMVPGGKEICEKQLHHFVNKVEKISMDDTQIDALLPDIYKKLSWLSSEELIKRFISVEFTRFLSYYKNAPDLNGESRERSKDRDRDRERSERNGRSERGDRNNRSERGDRNNRGERGDRGDRSDRGERRRATDKNFTRFFINIGLKDKLNPQRLIGLINDQTHTRNIVIGKIDIMKSFSFFEVETVYMKPLLKSFKNARFDGIPVIVEISKPEEIKPKRHQ